MTLEEAIKHCEEVAQENEDSAKAFYHISKLETHPDQKRAEDEYVKCDKCAAEHRQLAEWLKELKSIVRCRECFYGMYGNRKDICICTVNPELAIKHVSDFYCGYGKRKEERLK